MLKTRTLLKDSPIFTTFAVPDIKAAKRFYGETLGLDVRDGECRASSRSGPRTAGR